MCSQCRCKTPASQIRWLGGCGVGALLLCSVSLVLATFARDALAAFVNEQISATFLLSSPSSGQYAAFVDSDSPDAGLVTSTFWVYNVTNAADVIAGIAQPAVQEVGPLVYS